MNYRKPLLLTALALWLSASALASTELDRIVAVVNDDIVVNSELDQEINAILARIRERGANPPPRNAIEGQVLERIINQHLQLQAAERLGIQVDETTLARAINSIAERNGVSLLELRETLEAEGIGFASFRDDTREQIILARLRNQEVINRITITDQEVENFLAQNSNELSERSQVHLQHILVATPEGADPATIQQAKDKTERLMSELRRGADFAETALVHSDGRQALEGGDLGWMKLSQVPSIATEPARSLEQGEISEPVRTASGFHIFRLLEYKGGDRLLVTQTHARHILLKTNELVSDQEAETRLQQLRFRLLGGEDFSALARSHSDDTASAIKGGDLGWVNPGDTVPQFEEEMDHLTPGDISLPFRSPFGWHLLQVIERRDHDNTEEMARNKARESLRERKAEEATELWLRRLRDEAYVENRLTQRAY
jgi:peptidyl-prolyl cis-trans isomerase SurA